MIVTPSTAGSKSSLAKYARTAAASSMMRTPVPDPPRLGFTTNDASLGNDANAASTARLERPNTATERGAGTPWAVRAVSHTLLLNSSARALLPLTTGRPWDSSQRTSVAACSMACGVPRVKADALTLLKNTP